MREEFNRSRGARQRQAGGRATGGFALTILQRRLASSPEAIYQSLWRRRERLAPELDADDVEDLDDAPEQEIEDAEARILDQATVARSIVELKAELDTLKALDSFALGVTPSKRGYQVARAREPARRDLHGYRTGRPDRGVGHSRW